MSTEFDLALIWARLQLCFSSSTVFCSHLFIKASLALCFYRQRLNLVHPIVSMRLRPKKDLFWSRVFWWFSHKTTIFLSSLVSERGLYFILL
ncbi:hypothetical protein ES288_A13G059600v1 [Gossypium darwinii]|uniref:Uncharacterized protein n=1 Tax=Gossypium darwinii TaxID=34276 RepID=A0A5D2DWX3_GOSDA|nr:hypothetical protein ES288_A13G059600v1 [Gossypium darwinii]